MFKSGISIFVFVLTLQVFGADALIFGHRLGQVQINKSASQASIEWLDLETAADRNKEEKKFFFIDIYTDWCGWCKKMDQSTFKDSAVVEYMNQHFYAVKMNAESKAPIAYKEVLYESKMYSGKAYNELAVNLLSGKMSFPSFVVLSKKEEKLGTIVGYQKPTELLLALKGFVEK